MKLVPASIAQNAQKFLAPPNGRRHSLHQPTVRLTRRGARRIEPNPTGRTATIDASTR